MSKKFAMENTTDHFTEEDQKLVNDITSYLHVNYPSKNGYKYVEKSKISDKFYIGNADFGDMDLVKLVKKISAKFDNVNMLLYADFSDKICFVSFSKYNGVFMPSDKFPSRWLLSFLPFATSVYHEKNPGNEVVFAYTSVDVESCPTKNTIRDKDYFFKKACEYLKYNNFLANEDSDDEDMAWGDEMIGNL